MLNALRLIQSCLPAFNVIKLCVQGATAHQPIWGYLALRIWSKRKKSRRTLPKTKTLWPIRGQKSWNVQNVGVIVNCMKDANLWPVYRHFASKGRIFAIYAANSSPIKVIGAITLWKDLMETPAILLTKLKMLKVLQSKEQPWWKSWKRRMPKRRRKLKIP